MTEISEDDLLKIFTLEKRKRDRGALVFDVLNKVFLYLGLFIVVYITINFPAFKEKLLYWYNTDINPKPIAATSSQNNELATITIENTSATIKEYLPEMQNDWLNIPALGINAPIGWGIENISNKVDLGLENGVIHIAGTSLPGEKGNIYITGHSSNYVWAKGDYNSIFAVIGKLVNGDLVYIKYKNQSYIFKVSDQKVVAATDLTILAQTENSRLTLATCWPVGTSLKRLIVLADQIYPNPASNIASTSVNNITKLPGGR